MPFGDLLENIKEYLRGELPPEEKVRYVMELLHREVDKFDWVGVYLKDGDVLRVGPYSGPLTPHTIIGLDSGICGSAVREGRTIVVPDVSLDERFLACSITTKSEVVIPVFSGGEVIAELDVDSDVLNAFDPETVEFLEEVALLIEPFLKEII